jgi:arylsulfatase A-like enzyme
LSDTSRRALRWLGLADRLARGVLAAWALVGLELVVIAALSQRELASVWELEYGALWLAPSAMAATSLFGLAGAALFLVVPRADEQVPRLALALVAALLGAAVGLGVSGGRHLAEVQQRIGFAACVAIAAAGLVFVLAPRFARLLRRAPLVAALALGASIVVLELANRLVLPRLYPAFHYALGGLSLLLAPGLERGIASRTDNAPGGRRRMAVRAGITSLLLVASVALARPFSERLSRFDNFRFLITDKAPLLGRVVEVSARLAPPEPMDATGPCAGEHCAEVARAGERTLDLRERDVLLVSIDALRADHVTSYGYARPTTPHLDALAKEGALFERAYTATPHTSYAVTSLMTGKYMRPLLLQGSAADSDTWASLFRTYGYRTAAFYPPAVFFIDPARFSEFSKNNLGFEYAKVEFAEGEARVQQVREYLQATGSDRPIFTWVHLFSPHEPYERHPEFDFGTHDVDRYDSEIAAADETLGAIVQLFRARRPDTVVIVTADHGEEFEEHGGRYHGTTVYEEQVRVPLVISAPGAIAPRRISDVVQSIDVLPTLLAALDVPQPPRLRGRDKSRRLAGKAEPAPGFAHAETDEQTLLAEGKFRLICARRIGACRLYDLDTDPAQTRDAAADFPSEFLALRERLRVITSTHGRYESQGLRAEGKGWPAALLRGIAGDADAAPEVAELLDDVDPEIRRKAARVLFDLKSVGVAANLRLALARDEDEEVRRWAALTLTRLGEGAPLVLELLRDPNLELRRLAALALGESGDRRAEAELIAWWRDRNQLEFSRAREVLGAFSAMRS